MMLKIQLQTLCSMCLLTFILFVSIDAFSQYEFIGMEYHNGIGNRTFVVFVSDSLIWGGKVRNYIAAGGSGGLPIKERENPYLLVNPEKLKFYRNLGDPHKFLNESNANFMYKRSDIKSVTYTPKSKWGMGDVMHTGRLFLHFKKGGKKELILLGKPDIDQLKKKLDISGE